MNAISNLQLKRSTWQTAIMLTLGFWLSSSLVLDWVIMPSLYLAGMMNEANFATAGYTIFWNFNRLELLSAAVVLTAVLAVSQAQSNRSLGNIFLSCLLLTVAVVDTYFLTPQMCAVGSHLSLFTASAVPETMNLLHGGYFLLEVFKLVAGAMLLNRCWRESCEV
jgi:cytochrome bd-type quinol oxidase subunit 2